MTHDFDRMGAAEKAAHRRFKEAAEEYRDKLIEAWEGALPGNHTPAEALLFAHLLTANDGYNNLEFVGEWSSRRTGGWQTSMAYLADPAPALIFTFGFEARCEDETAQLMLSVEEGQTGVQTPERLRKANAAAARGYQVMALSADDIIRDPSSSRESVQDALFDLMDEVLVRAGKIGRSPAKPSV